MTDSNSKNIAHIDSAIVCLLDQLGQLAGEAEGDPPTDRMDKIAKSISVHIKAHADIVEHNRKLSEQAQQVKYTRYEDMPPPSPEDRERFKARFLDLIDKLQSGQHVPDHPEETFNAGNN